MRASSKTTFSNTNMIMLLFLLAQIIQLHHQQQQYFAVESFQYHHHHHHQSGAFIIHSMQSNRRSIITQNIINIFTLPSSSSLSSSSSLTRTNQQIHNHPSKHTTKKLSLYSSSSSSSSSLSLSLKKRSIKLPLLDLTTTTTTFDDDKNNNNIIIPLPSSHLPDELSTPHLYGMQVTTPLYKMLIHDVISKPIGEEEEEERLYGYVVHKSNTNDLVGAIGCAATLLIGAPSSSSSSSQIDDDGKEINNDDDDDLMVLSKGAFRFIVKEVVQSYPYPVAIVDELLDYQNEQQQQQQQRQEEEEEEEQENAKINKVNEIKEETSSSNIVEYNDFGEGDIFFSQVDTQQQQQQKDDYDDNNNNNQEVEEDDDDDDDDFDDLDNLYPNYTPSQLTSQTLQTLHSYIHTKLSQASSPSLLEQHILETFQNIPSSSTLSSQYEEMAAILDMLPSSLIDITSTEKERLYVIAMLAAEMASVENDVRREILRTRDGVVRMKIVLRELERKVSLDAAKKLTESISTKSILEDRKQQQQQQQQQQVSSSSSSFDQSKSEKEDDDGDDSNNDFMGQIGGDDGDDDSGTIMSNDGQDAKDLQVGTPTLPPWVSSIKKGTRVEYYWNDEYGWCGGTVTNNPIRIMDEIIIEVMFDDGESHKLPFLAEEKVRWRPG